MSSKKELAKARVRLAKLKKELIADGVTFLGFEKETMEINLQKAYIVRQDRDKYDEYKALAAKGNIQPHWKTWTDYLHKEYHGWHRQQAILFIRIAKYADNLIARNKLLRAHLELSSVQDITRPSCPPTARDEVLTKAAKRFLDGNAVQEIISRHKKKAKSRPPPKAHKLTARGRKIGKGQYTTHLNLSDPKHKKRNEKWKPSCEDDGRTGTRKGVLSDGKGAYSGTYSIFQPFLVEWIIKTYAAKKRGRNKGNIVDPFAGGPPRAVVATRMGFQYWGWETDSAQITENEAVLKKWKLKSKAHYKYGDGIKLEGWEKKRNPPKFDLCVTCPPYFDLEPYFGDHPSDLSKLPSYEDFDDQMEQFPHNLWDVLKPDSYVCIVVGNIRRKGRPEERRLEPFIADTIANFLDAGFVYWDHIELKKPDGSAVVRAGAAAKGLKLVSVNECLLVFHRPEKRTMSPAEKKAMNKVMAYWDGPDPMLEKEYFWVDDSRETSIEVPRKDYYELLGQPDPRNLKTVKISAKSANLRFILCGPQCIKLTNCTAHCCDSPGNPNGCLVTIHPTEKRKIEAYGVKVKDRFLQPRQGTKGCPFKQADHLCHLHDKGTKPFGCVASPFMLNPNGTLVIRNRYKFKNCFIKEGKKGGKPAYQTFRASLDHIFGEAEAKRICDHLNKAGGDIYAQVPEERYSMLKEREGTLKAK